MVSKILLSVAGLAVLTVIAMYGLSLFSHLKTPESGLVDGKLRPCPNSPNCVCSEDYPGSGALHKIPPVKVAGGDIDRLWQLLRDGVVDAGGEVVDEQSGYLRAEFTSTVFRFVDDLELRLDREQGEIHIRSASRVGHSDLGANRERIERIWERLGEGR